MRARRVASLSCLIALGACGGSGGGESANGSPVGGVDVSGRVLDAVNGVAIPGVEVRLARSPADGDLVAGSELAATITASDGRYAFADVPAADDYAAAFEVDGYGNEIYAGITLDAAGETVLEPVRLVSDDNAGAGQLAGVVVGAAGGGPSAENLTLDFRDGINTRSGEVIATARTAADGSYRVDGLGHGNVTAEIGGEGIRTRYATFQVLGNLLRAEQNVTVSAADVGGEAADAGALRIVLTWDERPLDLDAHLTGPAADGQAYFHVFSGDTDAGTARLVDDAAAGNGPEIIEIDRREAGIYRYSVFNFSTDTDRPLERSGARVEVLSGDMSVAEFTVPAGTGDLWTVFDIDDGRIVTLDTVTLRQNFLDHFPPQARRLAFDAAVASGAILPGPPGLDRAHGLDGLPGLTDPDGHR